jgi:hypothetical protein
VKLQSQVQLEASLISNIKDELKPRLNNPKESNTS